MPTLKQLQMFCDLAHCETMIEYAENNFVSQTSVSNALTRLETELGVQLFDRIGRNIVLNDYGKVYLNFVETGLKSIALGTSTIQNLAAPQPNLISISLAGSHLWGEVIGDFLAKNPEISIAQKEINITQIQKNLPDLDANIILCGTDDINSPYLDSFEFVKDNVRLYVPQGHPLSKRKSIHLIEAKDEKFICQPAHTGFSKFSDKLFKAAGFEPNVIAEGDYMLRKELLRKGVGVVLGTDSTLRVNFFQNAVAIKIDDVTAIRGMSLFWLKDKPLSPAAEKFKKYVIEFYSK